MAQRLLSRSSGGNQMLAIPRRYSYFVYGVIQSGLTCAIAAAIASFPFIATGTFLIHWLRSSFVAWITMLPLVLLAAPDIRRFTNLLTPQDLIWPMECPANGH